MFYPFNSNKAHRRWFGFEYLVRTWRSRSHARRHTSGVVPKNPLNLRCSTLASNLCPIMLWPIRQNVSTKAITNKLKKKIMKTLRNVFIWISSARYIGTSCTAFYSSKKAHFVTRQKSDYSTSKFLNYRYFSLRFRVKIG